MSYPDFDPQLELLPARIYAMVKLGRAYRVPYTKATWATLELSGEYPPGFDEFLSRFLAALRNPEWPAGSYFPGGWFRKLMAAGEDPRSAAITPERLGPFYGDEVRLDYTGTWTVGRKVVTGNVLQFFLRNLHYDAELQRYLIRYALENYDETRYVHHEMLPFRIVALEHSQGVTSVRVNDGSLEPLRWETLRMDFSEQLFVAIRNENLPAQFADGPRFALLDRLIEDGGKWLLPLDGHRRELALEAPWTGSGFLAALPRVSNRSRREIP